MMASDRRECPDCRELLVGECQCERRDTLRTRRGLLSTAETAGRFQNYAEIDAYRESVEEAERALDPGGPLASLVFAFLALLALASPVAASPLCEAAVAFEYSQTSEPRPKWAVSACRSVQKAARVYDVRETLAVAVAAYESDFKPWAVSHAGAAGVMQVKPAYYCPRWFLGLKWCTTQGEWVRAGVQHLAELLDDFEEGRALRSYNAGRRGASLGRGEQYRDQVLRVERAIRGRR